MVVLLATIVAKSLKVPLVVVWLTEMELNRTQTEFDDSLSLKIYLLQFVNYYASIIYIAFFKVRQTAATQIVIAFT